MNYLYLPLLIQSLLMGYDEYLHSKRGLGLWERLGHPLDTLTVFVPFSYIAINSYSTERLKVFVILSVFSCLFITKDEFIHLEVCSRLESWIHSLLFVLHPILFLSSGMLWKYYPGDDFLAYQTLAVGIFMIYQVLRWSFEWKKQLK